jgi:hypothetical protein
MRRRKPGAHDIAAEIIRRSAPAYSDGIVPQACYVFVSDPPTVQERLQVLAARLQGTDAVAIPRRGMTEEEWIARYCVADESQ